MLDNARIDLIDLIGLDNVSSTTIVDTNGARVEPDEDNDFSFRSYFDVFGQNMSDKPYTGWASEAHGKALRTSILYSCID